MNLTILSVGKPKKDFADLIAEYQKRLGAWSKLELLHLKDDRMAENRILKQLEKFDFKVILDERGKEFTSSSLALFLGKREMAGQKVVFVIGGAEGLSEEIKNRADLIFSLSKLTLAHDLALLVLVETLYRSLSILKNHPYHRA